MGILAAKACDAQSVSACGLDKNERAKAKVTYNTASEQEQTGQSIKGKHDDSSYCGDEASCQTNERDEEAEDAHEDLIVCCRRRTAKMLRGNEVAR